MEGEKFKNIYNIYLDESSIDNPKNHYMVIGGFFMQRNLRDEIKNKIKELRGVYNFYPELKWTKINKKNIPFAKSIIDLFFEYTEKELQFHCIVVDKTLVAYDVYHSKDKELAFYKFIYQLLQYKFQNEWQYYLFLDYKQNSDENRLKELWKFLSIVTERKYYNTEIKHIQSYCSKEMQLIQLADFFTWAVWYIKNGYWISESKKEIIDYITKKLWKDTLDFRSTKEEKKFNIFQINL